MPNPEHVALIKSGIDSWNAWRRANPEIVPNLSGADLPDLAAHGVDLSGAVLDRIRLDGANLISSTFENASANESSLSHASLNDCILRHADFRRSDLSRSALRRADCTGANLTGTNLKYSSLVGAKLSRALLSESLVYGVSVWSTTGEPAEQRNLIASHFDEPTITLDNLQLAQFVHILLENRELRQVIDTITSKVVLILGRFTRERKAVLDAIRDELRNRGYLPILFDFEKPANRDITETVSTLAHMARFVIADITDARSIPQELMAIVPSLPSVPVQPLLLASQREYGMFEHFRRFPWVLEPFIYEDQEMLLASLMDRVIGPAEAKAKEQTGR
jgi:uncharacterized protein YjbI with pentapeptide repeats